MTSRVSPYLRRLTLALAIGLAGVYQPSAAGQVPGGPRVGAGVRARAAQGGRVRVIVGGRASARAEGRLTEAAVASQRAGIRDRLDEVLGRLGTIDTRGARRFTTIPFFAADVGSVALRQLEADPDVVSIEEDVADRPTLADSVPLVGAPAAWRVGYSGAGWPVAILDTGIETTHPFLSGKVVSEACYSNAGGAGDGIPLCPDLSVATTAAGSGVNCGSGFPGCEHGTHVAGIFAGRGASFSGVARDAGIMSVQVFTGFPADSPNCRGTPCVLSYVSDQILGLERVLALHTTFNIAAVNMSLGGSEKFSDAASCDAAHEARKAAIDNLRSLGIATVISSGNNGYVDGLSAPACISSAISVGSTTKSDVLSSFSNTASFLSLLAPGESILSSVPGNAFVAFSGTSMAAPHVTGAWAIMKSRKPAASVGGTRGDVGAIFGSPFTPSGVSVSGSERARKPPSGDK
jgi:subtilisin